VYLLHRFAGLLHRLQRLAVDIRRLDGVYLLLECTDLAQCLLQGVFVRLLAFQRRLRGYASASRSASAVEINKENVPAKVQLTVLICVNILPGNTILLGYLVRQVCLSFLQHVELGSQPEDSILGGVVGPLGPSPSKPAPYTRHDRLKLSGISR
jgi:hypothetical protein